MQTSTVLSVLVFGLGFFGAIGLLAALYTYIDLKPTGVNPWPATLRNIVLRFGIAGIVCVALGAYRGAFLWGVLAYVVFQALHVLALYAQLRRKPGPTPIVK